MEPNPKDITQILGSIQDGDTAAREQLLPMVYQELKTIAVSRLGPNALDKTLGATSLVHETYLKLFDRTQLNINDRKHFYSLAALAMRQIVVDHARRKLASKRGAGVTPVDIDDAQVASPDSSQDVLALDQAMSHLEGIDSRLHQVVELRFFCGLGVEESAELLGVNARTVKRDWRKARAILYDFMADEDPVEG